MKTQLFRGIVIAILILTGWCAWNENRKPERPPVSQVSITGEIPADSGEDTPKLPDSAYRNSIAQFTYILFAAITAGVVVLKWVLPALGDKVAESFYSAPEKAEQTATHRAMALISQGEYHKALAAFARIVEENPQDRFAVVEMSRIYQNRLDDPDGAVRVLDEALQRDWPDDDKGFLLLKLADLHVTARSDFYRARGILQRLIAELPSTNHAATAHHKLREIEDQEFLAKRQ